MAYVRVDAGWGRWGPDRATAPRLPRLRRSPCSRRPSCERQRSQGTMPPFPKPSFEYDYNVQAQLNALREYEATQPGRDIPDRAADRLLIATWNIANLGRPEQG